MKEQNLIKVGDEFRTNPLSNQEGGSIIEVLKDNGTVLVYDKIKHPIPYVNKMNKENVSKIFLNGLVIWEQK